MYKNVFKRVIDLILSFVGLVILLPFFIIIAIAIYIDNPGPIFFTQKRIARNIDGKKTFFKIYKFRSMKIDTPKDRPTHLLDNPESYITCVGKFLRKTSLDELPQIINILLGDMSIVGPRPALYNQDDLYDLREKYRANDMVPGLTGWAQVNGRDELPLDVKARLDGEYVEKISFTFDIKCVIMTIAAVFTSKGVKEGGVR